MGKVIGVYLILNLKNGKLYVGQSSDVKHRLYQHRRELEIGAHKNFFLQESVNKYGIHSFEFDLLLECKEELLLSEEHYWCNLLDTHNRKRGYNILPTHPDKKNSRHSSESKFKIGIGSKGRIMSIQSKQKMIASKLGQKLSKEHKLKISVGGKGREVSKETRAKIGKSNGIPVIAMSSNGKLTEFESSCEAGRVLQVNPKNISSCLRGRRTTAGGYSWRYKTEPGLM